MATIKRISGDYTIQSINPSDNVNINTNTVTISGNLVVIGNTTQVETTNTSISDNIIVLNSNLGPSTTPTLNAGITVDRGNLANVSLIWNETVKAWQITDKSGVVYTNVATTVSTTTTNTIPNLYADPAPTLSANLNITGYTIYDTANVVATYTGTPNSGKSGLFVDNTNGTGQELATKSAAVAFSIIFG